MTRCLIIVLALLFPIAAAAEEPSDGAAPPEEAPKKQPAPQSEEDLLNAADRIAGQVAEIRGLAVKKQVDKGIKRRDELRAVLVEKLAEEVTDADIEAEAKVYKRLGVIPADLDYKKVLLDVLTEQIAGFYDQKTKELYIMEGMPMQMLRPAMAHELFHAIQDQHFDILRLQRPYSTVENSDFALARSALIEGDATVLMFDFSLYESGSLPQPGRTSLVDIPFAANLLRNLQFNDLAELEQMAGAFGGAGFDIGESALAKAPRIFREMLVFPYFAGMRFIVAARAGRTWAEVNEIYDDPPVSTEQILHPERYFDRDDPEYVTFDADAALPGWTRIYDSVLGEFQFLQYLNTHASQSGVDAAAAAAGWDGDRVHAWEDPKSGRVALALVSTWDSETEADEFYTAAVATTATRYPDAEQTRASGEHGRSTCLVVGPADRRERVYIERWGDVVLYLEGTPSVPGEDGEETNPATHRLREQIWKSLDRAPFSEAMEKALEARVGD